MISLVVPVYNVALYLDRCVDSIVGQTYTDLEIILVDDGSTDNSGSLCDSWAKRDHRIKVIHKKNGGLSDARNAGIRAATGEYIGFVDSDDWIDSEMYQDLLNEMKKHDAEMAATGIRRTYDNGYSRQQFICDKPYVISGDRIVQAYLRQCVFSTSVCDKLFRKELFDSREFPVGKQFEDAPVIFDIVCDISTTVVVGKPQYNYFQRADSICGQTFSIRKMDHYEFSKEIWESVVREYPQYRKEADAFFGCKLCEILYALYESRNRSQYKMEEKQLYSELMCVWKAVMFSAFIPMIMRLKTAFAVVHAIPFYIWLKSLRVNRA